MDVIYGKHSVRSVFLNRPGAVHKLVMREGAAKYLDEFDAYARAAEVEVELLPSGEFLRRGKLHEDDKHQGLFVLADPMPVYAEHDLGLLADAGSVLVLDQVSDPQNFGTVLRGAAFFHIDAVLWMKNRAVDISPTVTRIAVGGAEFTKLFRVTNLARSLQLLKEHGFWVYGLDERGDSELGDTDFDVKSALVVGAEGQGLRPRTKELCDVMVSIPGGRKGVESLNAGVAATLAMAELARVQKAGGLAAR